MIFVYICDNYDKLSFRSSYLMCCSSVLLNFASILHLVTLSYFVENLERLCSLDPHHCCQEKNIVLYRFPQKVLKIPTQYFEYLLITTRCSWKTRGIILHAIFLELCPFITWQNWQNSYFVWHSHVVLCYDASLNIYCINIFRCFFYFSC